MKKLLYTLIAFSIAWSAAAQDTIPVPDCGKNGKSEETIQKYRRSSLYSVLVKHPTFKYGEQIDTAFMSMPTPDKFNNHDLDIKSFESSASKQKKAGDYKTSVNMEDIRKFVEENNIAREMIAKWFCRDSVTGGFDMELIRERGHYDASQADIKIAEKSALGKAVLADAGEELIGKTFLLVNDITFVDKGEKSAKAGGWMRALGAVATAATGQDFSSVTDATASLVNEIDGFTVNITSYLYRLDWNDEIAGTFYVEHWFDPEHPDADRRAAFDTCSLFGLTYVGTSTASAANLSSKSFSAASKEAQILRVCTRAIDKSIVQLQRDYDEFKVNVPLYKINEDGTVDVQIGLKEGINPKSQFDVLMPVEDETGRTTYEKIGKLQPIEGRIWDNRFGADELAAELAADKDSKKSKKSTEEESEEAPGNVTLTASTFRVLSGANRIVPGCLVREVTIKRAE